MLQRLKKIISALTVTAMIFGIMPIGAFAENLNKADYEELNDGYLKVVLLPIFHRLWKHLIW